MAPTPGVLPGKLHGWRSLVGRWKAPPWGGGGRWVKAAETELTRTPPPPQPHSASVRSIQFLSFIVPIFA